MALAQCPSGMAATRGRLVCEEPRGDITLFERPNYRGRVFATSDDIASLPRNFNDIASSVRIARGLWKVCADANYRGRCLILERDTPNLIQFGFNDRISSLSRLPDTRYPGGSWRQSCRNSNLVGPLLTAPCLDRRGRYRTSTIDLRDCRVQRVENDNGRLVCGEADDEGTSPAGREDNLPPGSYRQSCRNEQFDGRRLHAQCRGEDRNWHSSDLDTRECDRDEEIVNDNGELACRLRGGSKDDAGPGPSGNEPPSGSYQRSCREIAFDGRYLTARCTDERNKLRNARLDTRDCERNAEIVNDDGDLVCRPRGPGGPNPGPLPPPPINQNTGPLPTPGPAGPPPINPNAPPPSTGPSTSAPAGPPAPPPPNPSAGPPAAEPASGGPGPAPASGGNPSAGGPGGAGAPEQTPPVGGPPAGQGGITLFENPNFEGRNKTFTADVADLGPDGWSDLASSLKIPRGRWEVCTDANFAGKCETLNADQANLPADLNDKITSLRRVRRSGQEGQPH